MGAKQVLISRLECTTAHALHVISPFSGLLFPIRCIGWFMVNLAEAVNESDTVKPVVLYFSPLTTQIARRGVGAVVMFSAEYVCLCVTLCGVVLRGVVARHGCCIEDKVQYTLGTHGGLATGGVPQLFKLETTFAYDYEGQRWGVLGQKTFVNGESFERIYVEDYNTMTRTFLGAGTCVIVSMLPFMTHMRQFCIPDNAELVETTRVGADRESVSFTSYEYDLQYAGNNTAHFKTAVDSDTCLPISQQAWFTFMDHRHTTTQTFFKKRRLEDDEENVFDRLDRYQRVCKQYRDWLPLEDEGERVWMMHEFVHLIKLLQGHDTEAEMDEERGWTRNEEPNRKY